MKRFKNILFFADRLSQPHPALARAITLARVNDARVTILDVIDEYDSSAAILGRLGTDLNEILKEHRRQVLEELANHYTQADEIIYTRTLTGIPFVEVIRTVISTGYDLVIKAARPPEGFSERVFGSTDMHLLRKCPCPVWIDRPAAALPYRQVLAAVDPIVPGDQDCARLVMDLASSLAQRDSAKLAVVHAWQLGDEPTLVNGQKRLSAAQLEQVGRRIQDFRRQQLNALLKHYDLSTDEPGVHLVRGKPAASIYRMAREKQADVVVMGTVGRTGIPGFIIGNTAEEVLQTTTSSVLAVKPAGFISPVGAPQ